MNCPLRGRGQGRVTHWKLKGQVRKNAEIVFLAVTPLQTVWFAKRKDQNVPAPLSLYHPAIYMWSRWRSKTKVKVEDAIILKSFFEVTLLQQYRQECSDSGACVLVCLALQILYSSFVLTQYHFLYAHFAKQHCCMHPYLRPRYCLYYQPTTYARDGAAVDMHRK